MDVFTISNLRHSMSIAIACRCLFSVIHLKLINKKRIRCKSILKDICGVLTGSTQSGSGYSDPDPFRVMQNKNTYTQTLIKIQNLNNMFKYIFLYQILKTRENKSYYLITICSCVYQIEAVDNKV